MVTLYYSLSIPGYKGQKIYSAGLECTGHVVKSNSKNFIIKFEKEFYVFSTGKEINLNDEDTKYIYLLINRKEIELNERLYNINIAPQKLKRG